MSHVAPTQSSLKDSPAKKPAQSFDADMDDLEMDGLIACLRRHRAEKQQPQEK
jgi:hypothetical protein